MAWEPLPLPLAATRVGDRVAYQWVACDRPNDPGHVHSIGCLWIWHNCPSPEEAPYGWRPSGVAAHRLVHAAPLTIEGSLLFTECCGLHGWIRDGAWVQA